MFLGDREPDHRYHTIRVIRDIVEVVAIIAAGCWAFYIFVYENRIKPSFADAQVTFSGTMEKVSQHDGLVAVRLKADATNASTVNAYFLGYAISVLGYSVEPRATPMALASPTPSMTNEILRPYSRLSKPTVAFSVAFITHLGNPASSSGLDLAPGQTNHREWIFYIPARRFDLLDAVISTRYTKDGETVVPTILTRRDSRATSLQTVATSGAVYVLDSLDLNGP